MTDLEKALFYWAISTDISSVQEELDQYLFSLH